MQKNTPFTVEDVVNKYSSIIGVKGINQITNQYGDSILIISQDSQLSNEEKKLINQKLSKFYEDVKTRKIENPANLGGRVAPLSCWSYYPGHVATVSSSAVPFRVKGRCTDLDEAILPFFLERLRYCGSNVVSSVELDRIESLYSQYQEVHKNVEDRTKGLNKIKHYEIRNGKQTEEITYKHLITRIESGIKLSTQDETLINEAVSAGRNSQEFKLSFPPESLTQRIAAKISLMDNIKDCVTEFVAAAESLGKGTSSDFAGSERLRLELESMLESHGHKSAVVFTMSGSSDTYPTVDYLTERSKKGDPVSHVYIGNLQAASLDVHLKFSDNGKKVVRKTVTYCDGPMVNCSYSDSSVTKEPDCVFSGSYDLIEGNNLTSIRNILRMIESSPTPVSLVVQKLDISHTTDIIQAIKNNKIDQIIVGQIDVEGPLVHKRHLERLWEAVIDSQTKLRDFCVKDSSEARKLKVYCGEKQGDTLVQDVDVIAFFAKLRDKVRHNSDTFDFNKAYEESVHSFSTDGQEIVARQANKIASAHTNEVEIIFGAIESKSGLGRALLATGKTCVKQEDTQIQSVKISSVNKPNQNIALCKYMAVLKKTRDWRTEIGKKQYSFWVLFTSLQMTLPYVGDGLSPGAEKLFCDIMSCDDSIMKELLLVDKAHVTELKNHIETTEVREMLRGCLDCETKRSKIDENGFVVQQLGEGISKVLPAISGICNMIIILQMQNVNQPPQGPMEACKISPVKTNECSKLNV